MIPRTIRQIVSVRPLVTIQPQETLRVACAVLNRENIGTVCVMDGDNLTGVLSERDVVRRAVGRWMNMDSTLVGEVMTPAPHTIDIDASLHDALYIMLHEIVRHLPVVNRGHVAGMLSIRDLPLQQEILTDLPASSYMAEAAALV